MGFYHPIHSSSFVQEAKTWKINPDEIQVSYDVVALYLSIPMEKSIEVMSDFLNANMDEIKARTKLSFHDLREMIELCLKKCYFLWRNKIYVIKDAGPIGLSLMVVMAEMYLQFLESKAIRVAFEKGCSPISFKRYVDDSHSRFHKIEQADQFLNILNAQDPRIQYTIDYESSEKSLPFLDAMIHNKATGAYEFEIYRKDAITNVQIKPTSSVDPKITTGVFKGFLARAWRICSEKYRESEFEFLVKVFKENGHDENNLRRICKDFRPPELITNEGHQHEHDERPTIRLPLIPRLTTKLKKVYKKKGFKVVSYSSANLKTLLCKNKDKLIPNSHPGVYKLDCSCGTSYVGETKKKVLTRSLEHQKDAMEVRWNKTGATEHSKNCHGRFNWMHPTTLHQESKYYPRKIAESLEIQCMKTGPGKVNGMNRDGGLRLTSQTWRGFFHDWRRQQPKLKRWRNHWEKSRNEGDANQRM